MKGRTKRENSPHAPASGRLAQQLRAAREDRDMTQQRLATLADVSIGTVRSIESRSVIEPGLFTIMAIAKALEYDIANFITSEWQRS